MKNVMLIFLSFTANFCLAQTGKQSFFNTDNIKSPEVLAKLLTASDTTDLQKVISLFKWITENIDYNVKQFENNNSYRYAAVIDEDEDDTTAPLKPLYERVAMQVLKRRTAVCGG